MFVNEDKTATEFIHFRIAGKDELYEKGESLENREPWRKAVSLGSRLYSKADITNRCILGNAAFKKYNKVWATGSLATEIKLYEAPVTHVLLYNCNSWQRHRMF